MPHEQTIPTDNTPVVAYSVIDAIMLKRQREEHAIPDEEYERRRRYAQPMLHWEGCYTQPGHHQCALAEIERLKALAAQQTDIPKPLEIQPTL